MISAVGDKLTKFKKQEGSRTKTIELDKENYENLYRVDFSLGLRFVL